ncbi:MAG: hypothetical protein QXQ50_03285 [Candidatus Bathyarchaeia archaeon]
MEGPDPEGYIDVNVFVYWLGNHPTLGRRSYKWIRKIEGASRGKYVTSVLTLYQIMEVIAGLTGKDQHRQILTVLVGAWEIKNTRFNCAYEQ